MLLCMELNTQYFMLLVQSIIFNWNLHWFPLSMKYSLSLAEPLKVSAIPIDLIINILADD